MPPTPLDRSSPVPLWLQLADDLRRRLEAGEFATRLPTDHELVHDYAVSRHTAREAVRSLSDEGLIERHRGRGTFLRPTRFEQALGGVSSLFHLIEDQGAEQRSVVRALEVRHDATVAAHLGLAARTPLVFLERLRCADGEPLAIDRAWLPARIAEPLLEVDFGHTGLYDELASRCGVVIDELLERIQPIVPAPPERSLLALPNGVAAFSVERLGESHGTPVEWRHLLLRGDRYAFVADWTGSTPTFPLRFQHLAADGSRIAM
jgi:GntR family transcriptional regulator